MADPEILGVHQGDVVVRTALVAALRDLRANPWLLDYAFASLKHDELTREEYGQQEIDRAKEWFQRTNVPVVMAFRNEAPKLPCLTVKLLDSGEDAATLADVHYQPSERSDDEWPVLVGPVTPGYDSVTGVLTLPADSVSAVLVSGQVVVTRTGKVYPVEEVVSATRLRIAKGLAEDFDQSTVRGSRPAVVTAIESVVFKERYAVGCHAAGAAGNPVHTLYLHSVAIFCLLRYRQDLLEARGFERSQVASGELYRDEGWGEELVYSRDVTLAGYYRVSWPKRRGGALAFAATQVSPLSDALPVEAGEINLDADPISGEA